MRSSVRIIATVLILSPPLLADEASATVLTVSAPDVRKGEVRVASGAGLDDDEHTLVADVSVGVTDRWRTGLEFEAERSPNAPLLYEATTWENVIRIADQTANFPVSLGVRLDYDFAGRDGVSDAISARLLLQRQTERFETRVNLGVEREVGSRAGSDVGGDLRASVRLRGHRLSPALDYLGRVERLQSPERFHQQDHRLGPVLYGRLGQNMRYEIGYLTGLSSTAPDQTLKLGVEYRIDLRGPS